MSAPRSRWIGAWSVTVYADGSADASMGGAVYTSTDGQRWTNGLADATDYVPARVRAWVRAEVSP